MKPTRTSYFRLRRSLAREFASTLVALILIAAVKIGLFTLFQ